ACRRPVRRGRLRTHCLAFGTLRAADGRVRGHRAARCAGLGGPGRVAGGIRADGVPLRAVRPEGTAGPLRGQVRGAAGMIAAVLLVLLAVLGAPLFAIIGASAMLGYHQEGIDLMAIAIEILGLAEMPFLSAIPLFTFAGYLLSESGAPQRLVRLTNAVIGWVPGGLALVALAACAFFTAFTGASGITIIALGAILYPALKHDGYPDDF